MPAKRNSMVLDGRRFRFSITPEEIASAIAKVEKYSVAEKVRRFDDVFACQPALLGAAVHLPSLGVDIPLADHAFNVLLVLFECFSTKVPELPEISTGAVQQAFDDNMCMVKFYERESPEDAERFQRIWAERHREQGVLAFVADYLTRNVSELTREHELVRNCCLAITNAYLTAYEAMP